MSEQLEEAETLVFDRVFNAAARARQELSARDGLLSITRRLFRRQLQRIQGKSEQVVLRLPLWVSTMLASVKVGSVVTLIRLFTCSHATRPLPKN